MEGRVHIDKALTNVSVRRQQTQNLVAERIYLPLPVDNRSDRYYIYGNEQFRVRDDAREPGTEAKQSRWSLSDDSYLCGGHALKDGVSVEDQNNADPVLDLLIDTTEVLTDQVRLNQEANIVTQLAADLTGNSLADQAATKWDDDTKDPIGIIRAQRDVIGKRIGRMPNVLVISQPVWTKARANAKVVGLITGAQDLPSALVSPAQFAAMCEVDEILIASASKLTSAEGQTDTFDWVWGKTALLLYRPPAPGRKTLALGYHMLWTKALGSMAGMQATQGVIGNGSQFVERYYWQPTKVDVVEVHKYYDQKTVCADAGVLFTNCIT